MAAVIGAGVMVGAAGAAGVAIKAFGEWQLYNSGACESARAAPGSVFLMSNGNNVLARQGEGVPDFSGAGSKLARQRAGGIKGGVEVKGPAFLDKVPSRAMSGDIRGKYMAGGLGNATSSQGNLTDILAKVPKKINGTDEYKKIARPPPSKQAGFGNQSFPQ
eukprot:CAMPEP_0182448278 /NCGR_PEP_ID=MMETSP1172-20130603/25661_1 /TAXON_ID=708627 /ORGANISM="Timspurckia oligopyrenoides, Strain CCMP3278" /LENGTH=161 /DNA_ID=CAMNT_0024645081 /DNA_START=138 /DNA_END=623 /DNA_ORIENTATION=-